MMENFMMMTNCLGFFSCISQTIWNTLVAISITLLSMGLGSTLVAVFIYNDKYSNNRFQNNEEESSSEEEEFQETETSKEYCERYWQAYNDLKIEDVSEERKDLLEKEYIKDDLPFWGNTVMVFNKEFHGFFYYNDKGSSIPYKMLGTLARKYVTYYNCKSLYINIEDELEISKAVLKEIINRLQHVDKKEDENDFFVKKKTKSGLSTEKANEYLVKGNFIKFKFKGQLSECSLLENQNLKDNELKKIDPIMKIDFETFKRMTVNQLKSEKSDIIDDEEIKSENEKEKGE